MAGQTSEEKQGPQWLKRCKELGVEVDDVERKGEILVLHLTPDAALPDAETLRRSARELKGGEVRYITVELVPTGGRDA